MKCTSNELSTANMLIQILKIIYPLQKSSKPIIDAKIHFIT